VHFHFFRSGNDNGCLGSRAGGRQQFLERFGVHNRGMWLTILDVMNIVGCSREGIYGHSDGADFCGAEKSGHELRGIRQHDQNAIAARNALRTQCIPNAIGERRQFAVGYLSRFADDGDPLRMRCGRRVNKVLGNIQFLYIVSVREFI